MDDATIRRLPHKVGAGDALLYKGGTYSGPHDDTDEYQLPPEYHDGYWMRWDEWVSFAQAIIKADGAARKPGTGEIHPIQDLEAYRKAIRSVIPNGPVSEQQP